MPEFYTDKIDARIGDSYTYTYMHTYIHTYTYIPLHILIHYTYAYIQMNVRFLLSLRNQVRLSNKNMQPNISAIHIQMLDMQYREYGDAEPVRGRRPRPPVMESS